MSYNTRGRPSNDALNVGQRRQSGLNNNFVSGGQLANQQQQPKRFASQQQQQQQKPQQQQQFQRNGNFPNQGQQQQQFRTPQQPQQQQQQSQTPQPVQKPLAPPPQPVQKPQASPQQQQQQQTQPQQQQQTQPQQQQQPPAMVQPVVEQQKPQPEVQTAKGELMETEEVKKRPFWLKPRTGRINKKEKMRRRNAQLSRILQPKNAIVILNELKDVQFVVSDLPLKEMNDQYKATVNVDSMEHVGYGKSKTEAKNNAAESALKHIVKTRTLTPIRQKVLKDAATNDDPNKMEIDDDPNAILPWQHVASYALFKLLHSWGEDPANATRTMLDQCSISSVDGSIADDGTNGTGISVTNKPAKKLPENAADMNPLMLLNQMLPYAKFDEQQRTGTPPNTIFTFVCNVNNEEFVGTGKNKKAAKKQAALLACQKLLGIVYPPEAMMMQV